MARGNGFPVNNSYSRWELRGVWIGCKVIVFQRHMTGAANSDRVGFVYGFTVSFSRHFHNGNLCILLYPRLGLAS